MAKSRKEEGPVGGQDIADDNVAKHKKSGKSENTAARKKSSSPVTRRKSLGSSTKKEKRDSSEKKPTQSRRKKYPVSKKKAPVSHSSMGKKVPRKVPVEKEKHPRLSSSMRNVYEEIPKLTDDEAWEDTDSDVSSNNVELHDSNSVIAVTRQDSDDSFFEKKPSSRRRKSQKAVEKPETLENHRWIDLQEQFLEFSNYRLLPGKSVHMDDLVASFREFRRNKRERPSKLGLTSATTVEIETVFEDWFYRKVRKGQSNGVYQGVHLNPKFAVKKADASATTPSAGDSSEFAEPNANQELSRKDKFSERNSSEFSKSSSKRKVTKKEKLKQNETERTLRKSSSFSKPRPKEDRAGKTLRKSSSFSKPRSKRKVVKRNHSIAVDTSDNNKPKPIRKAFKRDSSAAADATESTENDKRKQNLDRSSSFSKPRSKGKVTSKASRDPEITPRKPSSKLKKRKSKKHLAESAMPRIEKKEGEKAKKKNRDP